MFETAGWKEKDICVVCLSSVSYEVIFPWVDFSSLRVWHSRVFFPNGECWAKIPWMSWFFASLLKYLLVFFLCVCTVIIRLMAQFKIEYLGVLYILLSTKTGQHVSGAQRYLLQCLRQCMLLHWVKYISREKKPASYPAVVICSLIYLVPHHHQK